MKYELPFNIKLIEFELERYPGSESPSSFSSEVTVIDPENNPEFDYRIYEANIELWRLQVLKILLKFTKWPQVQLEGA